MALFLKKVVSGEKKEKSGDKATRANEVGGGNENESRRKRKRIAIRGR